MVFVAATLPVAAPAPQVSKQTTPTFYKDVLPLLQDHCQSCHRPGEVAPMPLVTYEQARTWASAIAHSVQSGMMPPWFADPRFGHFSNDPSLTAQQVSTLLAWVTGGTPAGDPHDAPTPTLWADGWNITKPDLVLPMPEPVTIPAAATWNTPTRSCLRISPKTNGSRWRKSIPPARNMCIMRWSTYGRRIPNGCGTRPSACPSPPRRSVIRRSGWKRTELPATYCWCTRPAVPRSLARGHGKVCPSRIRPGFPNPLHHERQSGQRSNQHRTCIRQIPAGAPRHHTTVERSRIHHSSRR